MIQLYSEVGTIASVLLAVKLFLSLQYYKSKVSQVLQNYRENNNRHLSVAVEAGAMFTRVCLTRLVRKEDPVLCRTCISRWDPLQFHHPIVVCTYFLHHK